MLIMEKLIGIRFNEEEHRFETFVFYNGRRVINDDNRMLNVSDYVYQLAFLLVMERCGTNSNLIARASLKVCHWIKFQLTRVFKPNIKINVLKLCIEKASLLITSKQNNYRRFFPLNISQVLKSLKSRVEIAHVEPTSDFGEPLKSKIDALIRIYFFNLTAIYRLF